MPEILDLRPSPTAEPDALRITTDHKQSSIADPPSVFDRCWRQYALFREHLFTDHTRQIASALQPVLASSNPCHLVEAGCGPGFYSRRLAASFPELRITGIDLSEALLSRARDLARHSGLGNCRFLKADALSLAGFPNHADAVIASRLFMVLSEPALALKAIFTTLRPGGICFIAEPTSPLRAALPLFLMRMTGPFGRNREALGLPRSRVLNTPDFEGLLESQPWRTIRIWKDRKYQCAICKKAA